MSDLNLRILIQQQGSNPGAEAYHAYVYTSGNTECPVKQSQGTGNNPDLATAIALHNFANDLVANAFATSGH